MRMKLARCARMRHDRVIYPDSGFTKGQALDYYRRVSKFLLPHLKNVPVSFKRYPDTIRSESFWEKDAPSFTPDWVKRVAVARRGGTSDIHYILINDQKTLLWLVDVGGIEIHPFLHRAPKIDVATSVVFDLDPGDGASLATCCEVAVLLRDALGRVGLQSLAKVSGSKGLQVYLPLNTNATHETTQRFARLVAEELARAYPKLVVAKMAKQLRARKVFIDWSQNADFKTTVAVYSLRTKTDPPFVSMPVTWKEVERADADALYFSPADALKRLGRRGDLFAPVLTLKQKLDIPLTAARSAAAPKEEERGAIVKGIRLPKPRSQSGRRLFLIARTDQAGDELWLDMHGKFKRWILRADRDGGERLIALPAGDFPVATEYFRGQVPAAWRKRVTIEDAGAWELIEGSYQQRRFDLWFTGNRLSGRWVLEKIEADQAHRSWALWPSR